MNACLRVLTTAAIIVPMLVACGATPAAAPVTSRITTSVPVTVRVSVTTTETETATVTEMPTTVEADTFTLTGTFTLKEATRTAAGCKGEGGYSDIAEGTSVTVSDATDSVVATGSLNSGKFSAGTCVFQVSVLDVPTGTKFYKIEISHRGEVTLSADEAELGLFGATLGD